MSKKSNEKIILAVAGLGALAAVGYYFMKPGLAAGVGQAGLGDIHFGLNTSPRAGETSSSDYSNFQITVTNTGNMNREFFAELIIKDSASTEWGVGAGTPYIPTTSKVLIPTGTIAPNGTATISWTTSMPLSMALGAAQVEVNVYQYNNSGVGGTLLATTGWRTGKLTITLLEVVGATITDVIVS